MTVCPNQELIGYQYDGGFAELMRVPAKVLAVDGVNRIPDGLSFAEASVVEPLSCVLNGQEQARVGDGDTVVVVGAGPIGCLHVRLARVRGAARVFLVEQRQRRLELAAGLVRPDEAIGAGGTDTVAAVRELTGGRGADVIIVAAASGQAQEDGLRMAARRGRVSFFGGLPKDRSTITVDANLVHYRELGIVGANGSSPAHNQRALELIAAGAVPVADLITHRLPLGGGGRGHPHRGQGRGHQGDDRALTTDSAPFSSRAAGSGRPARPRPRGRRTGRSRGRRRRRGARRRCARCPGSSGRPADRPGGGGSWR